MSSYHIEPTDDGWIVRTPTGTVANSYTHKTRSSAERHRQLCEVFFGAETVARRREDAA